MRDYTGIAPHTLPKPDSPDFQNRARSMLSDIDYFLRDLNRGISRIQQGEIPDGSGTPIGTGGTLTDYWYKPGIPDPFIAYMSTGDSAGGLISSTIHPTKGFINLGNTEYVDESQSFVGINVTAPAASLHLQPAVSGTETLLPSTDLDTNWDGPRDAAQSITGGSLASAVNVNDGSTKWAGFSSGLGVSPQQFNMNGTITAGRSWTVNIYCCILSGTWTAGDLEFHIRDENGDQYSYTETGTFTTGATFPTFSLKTFTIDGGGTSTGTGTANSIKIGIEATAPVGAYCACTYIEITTGGDSDIARWNNGSGSLLGKINSDGYFGIGTEGDTLAALLTAEAAAATDVVSIFKGATSQSGNLTEWQSQAGAILSRIKSDGTFEGPISTTGAVSVTDNVFSILDNVTPTKIAQFQCATISAATTRTFTFPDATGTLALIDLAQTWTALQTFRDTTFKLVDDGDATKTLVFSLGGATAGADLTLSWAGAADRTVALPALTGLIPVVGDDAPAVASGALGKVDLTAQGADITTTALSSTPPAGFYEVEVYLLCTTLDAGAGNLTVTIGWTDNVGATTSTPITVFPLTATGRTTGRQIIRVSSSDITYAVANSGAYGAAQFAVYVRTVFLG